MPGNIINSKIVMKIPRKKKFMTIFEFIGQFFLTNDVFKLQEVFSELGIKVFFENGLEYFQAFLILLRQTREARKIPNTVLKTRLKIKETTHTLVFRKYLVVSFQSHSIRAFPVFLDYS
jgi:hypothetical protein